ncbi:MAG: CBS domain-containing protein [Deltaproteobacteria bacterium]|jgi:tRNA nucleotidyltransferase (CCA-adding enzyme)|nr:CBS domain-containing protein [Deltaproteobacteria bacterium]
MLTCGVRIAENIQYSIEVIQSSKVARITTVSISKKINQNKDVTVITTHINADFDALASMLAAQKLYPEALVVFPGSQEKNLKNFFINSMAYLFNMVDINRIDFDSITRLVLVDTRQTGRIGRLADLLGEPGVEIHIYDHHPPGDNDIKGTVEVHGQTGANVTILTEIIRDKEIAISPDEATIMCLGIYEDTGSFTFPSTTERDFRAAAYLLSQGANLNVVSNLIARELSPQQVVLLNDMIQAVTRYYVNGIEVVVTSVTMEKYMPDFAFLVQKMVKMENLDAIFAIARMENKIYVVARSRINEVDVGAILASLGGGGHPYAAAASIKGKTLAQTEKRLVEILYQKIKASRQAKDLMSSPAISIKPDVICKKARNIITRYNLNALLVTEKINGIEKLCGYITRQVIEKALYHKLDEVQVKDYMTTEVATVEPDADLIEIQKKIIDNKQRILPVVDNGTIVGVITRTDLLNILVRRSQPLPDEGPDPAKEPPHAHTRNIVRFMKERLSADLIRNLQQIGEAADEIGAGAYVVGGFVRDLFLYRSDEDIDIVIEGDGIAFAKKYAKMVGARIHTHQKFGTAVIIFPDGFKIDVASARMEYYKFPAALPVVEMSSIKLDLYRRDFTINTLAIQLNSNKFGTLIDFFSARKDIKEKIIRVLHNLSFVEDPTRVFRAIRFEQRFEFTIGKLTAGLIANAISMDFFRELSGKRVVTELRLILQEENPVAAIRRLNDFDLLKVIHPSIKLDKVLMATLNSAKEALAWHDLLFLDESYNRWIVYFLVLIRNCKPDISKEICRRFELKPEEEKMLCSERFRADKCVFWLERNLPVSASVIYRKLNGFKTELILFMMAVAKKKAVKKSISHYFTDLCRTQLSLRGRDLKKMGLKPGPAYRQVMEAVLDARLDGTLKSKKDEIEFARRLVAEQQAIPGPG